jgi:hypothetical protein
MSSILASSSSSHPQPLADAQAAAPSRWDRISEKRSAAANWCKTKASSAVTGLGNLAAKIASATKSFFKKIPSLFRAGVSMANNHRKASVAGAVALVAMTGLFIRAKYAK